MPPDAGLAARPAAFSRSGRLARAATGHGCRRGAAAPRLRRWGALAALVTAALLINSLATPYPARPRSSRRLPGPADRVGPRAGRPRGPAAAAAGPLHRQDQLLALPVALALSHPRRLYLTAAPSSSAAWRPRPSPLPSPDPGRALDPPRPRAGSSSRSRSGGGDPLPRPSRVVFAGVAVHARGSRDRHRLQLWRSVRLGALAARATPSPTPTATATAPQPRVPAAPIGVATDARSEQDADSIPQMTPALTLARASRLRRPFRDHECDPSALGNAARLRAAVERQLSRLAGDDHAVHGEQVHIRQPLRDLHRGPRRRLARLGPLPGRQRRGQGPRAGS